MATTLRSYAIQQFSKSIETLEKLLERENEIYGQFDLDKLLEMVNQGVPRQIFFSELKNSIRKAMLNAATIGYTNMQGAHLPLDTSILDKAIASQLFYANRYESSGDKLEANRIGMYAEESEHIGTVVGMQTYFKEHGAKRWRRVVHPELSKTGACANCIADARITHSIEQPFFDHPNGKCSSVGVMFETEHGSTEIPVPGHNPHTFLDRIKQLLGNVTSIVRRFRK